VFCEDATEIWLVDVAVRSPFADPTGAEWFDGGEGTRAAGRAKTDHSKAKLGTASRRRVKMFKRIYFIVQALANVIFVIPQLRHAVPAPSRGASCSRMWLFKLEQDLKPRLHTLH
jgi:hypothetical protein